MGRRPLFARKRLQDMDEDEFKEYQREKSQRARDRRKYSPRNGVFQTLQNSPTFNTNTNNEK